MGEMLLTLVHSPLVGPATWTALAAEITDRGYQVEVPDLTASVRDGPPYASRQVEVVAAGTGRRSTALVGHSGAGPLLGAIAEALDDVLGLVFIDAGLPAPGMSVLQTMPPPLAGRLRDMARDGWLPPWTAWWGEEVLRDLIADAPTRERFVVGCRPLPLAMFEEAYPPAPHWRNRPAAYLRLSEAYQEQAGQARDLGWPVAELPGNHLSLVTDPKEVAAPLLELVDRLRR